MVLEVRAEVGWIVSHETPFFAGGGFRRNSDRPFGVWSHSLLSGVHRFDGGLYSSGACGQGPAARVQSRQESRGERASSGGRTRTRAEMRIGAAESSNSAAPIRLDALRVGSPCRRSAGSGGEDQREHSEIEQDDDGPEQD